MKRVLLLVLLIFTLAGNTFAQERLVNRANTEYQDYSFSPAIDIYKKVLDKGYVSADLLKRLGNAYYFKAEYKEAAETYQRLMDEYTSEMNPEYLFRYAQTLRTLGEYEKSDSIMTKFAAATSNDNRASAFNGERDYLAEISKNSGRYDLKPFGYNSVYSEFAPAFYEEGLIFSSDRDTGNLSKYRHTWNAQDFLDLYKVNVDGSLENNVFKLNKGVNTRLHESTSIVTKDGKTLYFTRNNFVDKKYVKGKDGVIRLKIFKATWDEDDKKWISIIELPFNSNDYSVANPALSPDEKTLFFASDMPGSLGESDIFKVTINNDGTYGEPANLGNTINTEARETFPFVTSDEVLYFSSDGHPGLGGLDVFATKIRNEQYSGPIINVGEPVNSKQDDFSFIINEENKKGYFASNREGGLGADDIYSFVETTPLQLDCVQIVTGTVRDKVTNEILVGATVVVIDEENKEIARTITDGTGQYSIELDCNQGNFVRALIEGYIPSEEYLEKSNGKDRIIDFYLERDTITAGFGDDLSKLLQLSTIYFDLDKYNIRPDAEIEIQKVIAAMEKYPSLKVKVNSHTDSRARDAYNLRLSENRARSTVEYMVSKGIAAERLLMEGYGETKLINKCSNGVKCSSAEHQLNRRSEFIIIE